MKICTIQILIFLAFVISGCVGTQSETIKYPDFVRVRFPSDAYAPGQIIEISPSKNKIEKTFDPKVPIYLVEFTKGWNISASEEQILHSNLENTIANLKSAIKETLKNSASPKAEEPYVNIAFVKIQTESIPKNIIFAAIEKSFYENPTLTRMLYNYRKNGTHFDIITRTLDAKITISLVNVNGSPLDLDLEVIKKINSTLNLHFEKTPDNKKIITRENVVVGIHYDRKMLDIIMK
ncbi:MAG: hypothetical protein DID92_2727744146 [Candidatus Nitrotoga sp. SPKER]|nr:MAG: hypothetical protein DID92_2727744146 [Candidatus Nitrotoga sp. SPKER]